MIWNSASPEELVEPTDPPMDQWTNDTPPTPTTCWGSVSESCYTLWAINIYVSCCCCGWTWSALKVDVAKFVGNKMQARSPLTSDVNGLELVSTFRPADALANCPEPASQSGESSIPGNLSLDARLAVHVAHGMACGGCQDAFPV